jgi:hypothetical protein
VEPKIQGANPQGSWRKKVSALTRQGVDALKRLIENYWYLTEYPAQNRRRHALLNNTKVFFHPEQSDTQMYNFRENIMVFV